MGVRNLLKLLPLVVSFGQAQNIVDNVAISDDADAGVTEANATEVDAGTPPNYTPEECDFWIGLLVTADSDASGGLSESEYHSFLSSIDDPPYIARYFTAYENFDRLPWVFRVVHKSLSCHCEKLGFGAECCEGDDAEVLAPGSGNTTTIPQGDVEDYQDLLCQQLAYVLEKSVPSPAPTTSPTLKPTFSPSGSPTLRPSGSPTLRPTPSPSRSPAGSPTDVPSTSFQPSMGLVIAQVVAPVEENNGIGTGGIIGIIIAILALLLALIAFVAYRRKKEGEEVKQFAGDQAPEADLEAPVAAVEEAPPQPEPEASPEPEPAPAEPEEDDESSAPSVWSESDAEEDTTLNDTMVDDTDEVGMTAGSALAAMGAASTVAANMMSPTPGSQKAGGDGEPSSGVLS